jgi:hypothetical protein
MFSKLKSNMGNAFASSVGRGALKGGLIGGGIIGAGILGGYAIREPMPGPVGSKKFNDRMRAEMKKRGIPYG